MSDFVNTVDSIGDEALTNSIIKRSITEIRDNYATSIGPYSFNSCTALTTVDFPSATSIGRGAFRFCSSMTAYNFPAATSIESYAFGTCAGLTAINFPAVTSIGNYAFDACSNLTTVILPSETMVTLENTRAFQDTPIKSGTGYIYVPAALVDSYKADSIWSYIADQIRAIEDYPDICGT